MFTRFKCRFYDCVLKTWASAWTAVLDGRDPPALFRGMAGHSKWQNIKHTKAAMDAKKAANFSRCLQLIRVAVRDSGTTDPSKHLKLAHAVQQARQNQVPKNLIENALKIQSESSKESATSFTMEVKGPGGTFFIIELLTDNSKRTMQLVRAALNRTERKFSVLQSGSISKQLFQHKGIINVEIKEGVSLEAAVDHAIEVGAEEVSVTEDHEGKNVLQFVSDANDFYTVKKNLEDMNYTVTHSEILYLPQVRQPMSDEDMELTRKLYENLEALPEVVKIHDNVE